MDRYAGRPFLRLLECFVLDAIGQLDDRQRDTLRQIEPKLRETYGREGTWARIIAGEMDFPEALSSEIRTVWGKISLLPASKDCRSIQMSLQWHLSTKTSELWGKNNVTDILRRSTC
jgi:hypothetical protein